ncbi:NUMOD4 domain-containing protein [Hymenobacter sp. UYCo722]|uniref:NUMOD4 domain-containing protein n=1 Tax=Hymenobacter sp. UYCo722 TaxID=3156335 RepID=UPI003397D84C
MNNQNEIWKDCKEFVGYQVSNKGQVRVNGLVKPQHNDNGYRQIAWEGKQIRVHRIVAAAFCSKPEGCDIVNHIDGSRDNNHADNLEWTTSGGNTRHAAETGLLAAGERHARTELTESVVLEIDALLRAGIANGTIAEQTGVSREVVSKIKAGRTWTKLTGRTLAPVERKGAVGKSKLTSDQVADIRCRVAAGESMRAVAASYSMSHTTISSLINGITWN